MSQEVEKAPLAALSLLTLAAVDGVEPAPRKSQQFQPHQQFRSIPRSAPTTSVTQPIHHPYLKPSAPPLPATTTSTLPIVPASYSTSVNGLYANGGFRGSASSSSTTSAQVARGSTSGSQPKARRLSSASASKKRHQDASAATLQATAASLLANSGVSAAAAATVSPTSPALGAQAKATNGSADGDEAMDEDGPVFVKKKGQLYRCESCSKVYRHPNCLLKHRWEHSPHWRETSKFLLSKHQQVQLLEAAAILSHINAREENTTSGGSSLPDDRALWPSYLSGGLLPVPMSGSTVPPSTKPSNLAATKARATLSPTLGSFAQAMKKRESSEEEGGSSRVPSSSRRTVSASMPSGGYAGLPQMRSVSSQAAFPGKPPNLDLKAARTTETEKDAMSPTEAGFNYGSAGVIRHITSPIVSPTNPTFGHSQSYHQQYMMHHIPPYARGGARPGGGGARGHHRRTSSSMSSSFSRSSVRGGEDIEDEDEDEDDDNDNDLLRFDDDLSSLAGFMDRSSFATSVSMSQSGPKSNKGGSGGEEYEFGALDEKEEGDMDEEEDDSNTVDEESDPQGGGAGMEIDMEL